MRPFTDLKVWQRSHQFVLEVYRVTKGFPSEEKFGLTAQLRKAACSVPSNIAEGSRRRHTKDFAHFLNIAEASLAEASYQLMLGRDLQYLEAAASETLLKEADEIARMLYSLRTKLEHPTPTDS